MGVVRSAGQPERLSAAQACACGSGDRALFDLAPARQPSHAAADPAAPGLHPAKLDNRHYHGTENAAIESLLSCLNSFLQRSA